MHRDLGVLAGATLCAGQAFTASGGTPREGFLRSSLGSANGWLDAATRLEKYEKMGATPFSFARGTAHLYYADLQAQGVRNRSSFAQEGTAIWAQGDLHVENIGIFQDDSGDIVADMNDFDEGYITSYLHDVWRLASSIALISEQQNREEGTGFSAAEIDGFIDSFTQSYLNSREGYRGNDKEVGAKFTAGNTYGRLDNALRDVAEEESRAKMLAKWTEVVGGVRRMKFSYKKLADAPERLGRALHRDITFHYHRNLTGSAALRGNAPYFTVKSIAQRLGAGTGSYGTPRYYVLVEGATLSQDDDVILDVKRQGDPSVHPYLTQAEKGRVDSRWQGACRIAVAQDALRNNVDDHLGCLQVGAESYSVRERSPFKEDFDYSKLTTAERMSKLCEQWGAIVAAAHARSDDDFMPGVISASFEEAMHAATEGRVAEFQKEVRDFAVGYTAQVNIDFAIFKEMLASPSEL